MDARDPRGGAADAELDGLIERIEAGLRTVEATLLRSDEALTRSEIALAQLRRLESLRPGERS
jgi:hypothetical protein